MFHVKKTPIFIQALKVFIRRPRLIIILILFFLLIFFYFIQGTNEQSGSQGSVAQSRIADKVSPGLPVRLIIPAINVNAGIQQLGINPRGEMDVPSNIVDVGWFKLGVLPGEKGSAVIDGHLDGKNGDSGVFADLYKLQKGDKVYIEDDKGSSFSFVVRESRAYHPGYAADVFVSSDSAHLNLITCNGAWDKNKKSYSKRLVVFADIIP